MALRRVLEMAGSSIESVIFSVFCLLKQSGLILLLRR